MRSTLLTLLVCAALSVLPSCGGDDSAYDTMADAVEAMAEAFCARGVECEAIDSTQKTTCENEVGSQMCSEAASSGRSCGEGWDSDDDDALAECLDALAVYPCDGESTPPECFGVL